MSGLFPDFFPVHYTGPSQNKLCSPFIYLKKIMAAEVLSRFHAILRWIGGLPNGLIAVKSNGIHLLPVRQFHDSFPVDSTLYLPHLFTCQCYGQQFYENFLFFCHQTTFFSFFKIFFGRNIKVQTIQAFSGFIPNTC